MRVLLYRLFKKEYIEKIEVKKRQGFTLLELLIALFLAVILGSIGYLAISKRMRRERLVSEMMAFSNDLHRMKSKALTENRRSGVWIVSDKNYDLIYYDDNGVKHTIMSKSLNIGKFGYNGIIATCPDGSSVDTGDGVSFPNNEILFLPIGTPTASGCILINSGPNIAAVIVTPSGDIKTFIFDERTNSWIER